MRVPGISKRAVARIREAWANLPAHERDNWIAVISEEGDVKPIGRSMNVQVIRYPVMGWYERDQIPRNLTRACDGIDIAFNFDDSAIQLHQSHIVDYIDGRLAWVEATDVETDGAEPE
jgi:hypothetical protein